MVRHVIDKWTGINYGMRREIFAQECVCGGGEEGGTDSFNINESIKNLN